MLTLPLPAPCQARDFIREHKIFEMWPRKGTLSVGERTIITFKYNPTHEGKERGSAPAGRMCVFCKCVRTHMHACTCIRAACWLSCLTFSMC